MGTPHDSRPAPANHNRVDHEARPRGAQDTFTGGPFATFGSPPRDEPLTLDKILEDMRKLFGKGPPPRQQLFIHPDVVRGLEAVQDLEAPRSKLDRIRNLAGIDVFETKALVVREQVRFPRSKRKRIRKKWRKDPRNWREKPAPYAILSEAPPVGYKYFFPDPIPHLFDWCLSKRWPSPSPPYAKISGSVV